MTTVYAVKDRYNEKVTEISNKHSAFWAFSKEQFEKGINRDLAPYVDLGGGNFVPKANADKYIEDLNNAYD